MAGASEAVVIAHAVGIPVLSIRFRQLPGHPFPAALDDIVAVWRNLVEERQPSSIGFGGTSSGGNLALASIMAFRSKDLKLPGALYLGSPWADLTETGDSRIINEGVDRRLITYRGLLWRSANLYAGDLDLGSHLLSPLYGDLQGFPPTILFTGTRDLFLSDTIRTHQKLRSARIPAELHVFEGLSNGEFVLMPKTDESKRFGRELRAFLDQHLR